MTESSTDGQQSESDATGPSLRCQLDALVEEALTASTAGVASSWGPIELELSSESVENRDDILRYLAPGRGTWPTMRIVTMSSRTIPMERIPTQMRPIGETSAIVRDDDLIAIASGHEHSLWILRADLRTAVRWVTDTNDVPLWEQLSPLRTASRWDAAANGAATVHCGAVGNENGAVLLVGDAGAGKSTTTMACLGTGLEVLGDDFCFVDPTEPAPMVDAMYRLAKLDERSLDLLPHLRDRVVGTGLRGKSLIELDQLTSSSLPIRAVCHVTRDHSRPTGLEPLSRMQALRAAAPSTIFQVRLAEQETWNALSTVIRKVAAHRLHVDRVADAPAAITELLESTVCEHG
ncbi:MAG: hypothetical protein ACI83Y_001623 [Candidatus Azotimanducaceae bacterium]